MPAAAGGSGGIETEEAEAEELRADEARYLALAVDWIQVKSRSGLKTTPHLSRGPVTALRNYFEDRGQIVSLSVIVDGILSFLKPEDVYRMFVSYGRHISGYRMNPEAPQQPGNPALPDREDEE